MRRSMRTFQSALLGVLFAAASMSAVGAVTVSQPQFLPGDPDTFKIVVGLSNTDLLDALIAPPETSPFIDAMTAHTTSDNPPFLLTRVALSPALLPGIDMSRDVADKNFLFLEPHELSAQNLLEFTFDLVGPSIPSSQFDWQVLAEGSAVPHNSFIAIRLDLMRLIQDDERQQGFLLAAAPAAVPEPESALMLAAGLGLLGLFRLRRRASS